MIRHIGPDVHKEVVQACVIDEQGHRLESHQLPCTKESLEAFARERLGITDHLALEATTNTRAVVALLRPHVGKIVVGNPLRTARDDARQARRSARRCHGRAAQEVRAVA